MGGTDVGGTDVGGDVTPPVQSTPFSVNSDGAGLLPVQLPLKPNDTVAPVAIEPL